MCEPQVQLEVEIAHRLFGPRGAESSQSVRPCIKALPLRETVDTCPVRDGATDASQKRKIAFAVHRAGSDICCKRSSIPAYRFYIRDNRDGGIARIAGAGRQYGTANGPDHGHGIDRATARDHALAAPVLHCRSAAA